MTRDDLFCLGIIVFLIFLSTWILKIIYSGLKDKKVRDRSDIYTREVNPIKYWVLLIAQVLIFMYLIYIIIKLIIPF